MPGAVMSGQKLRIDAEVMRAKYARVWRVPPGDVKIEYYEDSRGDMNARVWAPGYGHPDWTVR